MNAPTSTIQQIWAELKPGESIPLPIQALLAKRRAAPWYVQLMLAIAAWIAAGMLLGFLSISDLTKSAGANLLIGSVLCGLALSGMYWQKANTFISQLALAFSLAGMALFAYGGYDLLFASRGGDDLTPLCLVVMCIEVPLLLVYPDTIRRFISVELIYAALQGIILERFPFPEPGFLAAESAMVILTAAGVLACWENESRMQASQKLHGLFTPLGFGLPVAWLALMSGLAFVEYPDPGASKLAFAIQTGTLALLLIYLERQVIKELDLPLRSPAALILTAGTVLLALPMLQAPGVFAALLLLALGFRRGRWTLVGLAAIFLVGFFARYYYLLSATLLVKSLALIVSGGLLLGMRLLLQRAWPAASPPAEKLAAGLNPPGSPGGSPLNDNQAPKEDSL